MSPLRLVGRTFSALLALLSALLIGSAAGAAWMVLGLYLGRDTAWLILPLGVIVGLAMRNVTVSRPGAAVLAGLATLLAAFYVSALIGAMRIAASLGLSFAYALRQAGPGMLYDLAAMAFTPAHWLLVLAGMVLAAWAAAWRRR